MIVLRRTAPALALPLFIFLLGSASAQSPSVPQLSTQAPAQAQQTPANPLGASSGWSTNIAPNQAAQQQQAEPENQSEPAVDQTQLINRLSAYFNSVEHLEGSFVQINPNSETTKGKFYVQRPGLMRFDYAAPSKLRIIADGRYLSIEDHDLQTVDQYPLDATPFRLLLSNNVDLLRDAEILDFSNNGEIANLTLVDKSKNAHGKLQLFFATSEIELKEWVITDPQGLDTRIQLSNLVLGHEKKKAFFKSSALEFQNVPQQ